MVSTGFKERIGSWKIMAMPEPRMSRSVRGSARSRSVPSKSRSSACTFSGGSRTRRMIESAVTLFPDPLSPTSPSTSPGSSVKDTPLTARIMPWSVLKLVVRSRTVRSAMLSPLYRCGARAGPPRARIESVAQTIPDEIDRQYREHDRCGGGKEKPGRVSHIPPCVGEVATPGRVGRLRAEAQEGERRLGNNRRREADRELHHNGRQDISQDVPRGNAERRSAKGGRCHHIDLLTRRKRAGPHDARQDRHLDDADREHDVA